MAVNNLKNRLFTATQIIVNGKSNLISHRGISSIEIPALTDEEVSEAKQFFPLDKFFIFGHARSGTTLLARLIRAHPQVHCNYQGHFFTRPPLLESLVSDPDIHAWLTRRSNRWNRGRDLSPVVLRAVADYILERDARRINKAIVGDKSPNSLMNGKAVQLLSKVYPDASLIYILRDGRDAIISHRFQSFIDSTQHLTKADWRLREVFMQNPEAFNNGKKSIFTEKGLHHAAQGWVQNIQETIREGKNFYDDRFITLRFETLIEQPWMEIKKLWDFLGADTGLAGLEKSLLAEFKNNPDADWQMEKARDIAQNLQKGQTGYWKQILTLRDKEIFSKVAGETLLEWGYAV